MAAASTFLTMACGVTFTTEASANVLTRMIPHLADIDPALGNLIPVGDEFGDEDMHALAIQRLVSASAVYSASADPFAFLIECQIGGDCITMLDAIGDVPALVIWPSDISLHDRLFSNLSLNVASRVG